MVLEYCAQVQAIVSHALTTSDVKAWHHPNQITRYIYQDLAVIIYYSQHYNIVQVVENKFSRHG